MKHLVSLCRLQFVFNTQTLVFSYLTSLLPLTVQHKQKAKTYLRSTPNLSCLVTGSFGSSNFYFYNLSIDISYFVNYQKNSQHSEHIRISADINNNHCICTALGKHDFNQKWMYVPWDTIYTIPHFPLSKSTHWLIYAPRRLLI